MATNIVPRLALHAGNKMGMVLQGVWVCGKGGASFGLDEGNSLFTCTMHEQIMGGVSGLISLANLHEH